MRDEYLKYIKDNKISEAEGFMIPHVSGLDVAGIERNNLPAELHPFTKRPLNGACFPPFTREKRNAPRA